MKLKGIFLFVLALALLFSGCSAGVPLDEYNALKEEYDALQHEYDELYEEFEALKNQPAEPAPAPETDNIFDDSFAETAPVEEAPNGAFNSEDIISQLEITDYKYSTDWGNYLAVVIKNNSAFDLNLEITASFLDSANNLIGTSSGQANAFEAGYETAFVFNNEDPFDSVKYEFWVEEETRYSPVLSSISVDVSTTDKKAIISITNNGNKPAQFVQYTALFFKNEQLVDYGWGYCVDGDSEIKPGKTQRAEAGGYEKFDTVKVYITGRAEK